MTNKCPLHLIRKKFESDFLLGFHTLCYSEEFVCYSVESKMTDKKITTLAVSCYSVNSARKHYLCPIC